MSVETNGKSVRKESDQADTDRDEYSNELADAEELTEDEQSKLSKDKDVKQSAKTQNQSEIVDNDKHGELKSGPGQIEDKNNLNVHYDEQADNDKTKDSKTDDETSEDEYSKNMPRDEQPEDENNRDNDEHEDENFKDAQSGNINDEKQSEDENYMDEHSESVKDDKQSEDENYKVGHYENMSDDEQSEDEDFKNELVDHDEDE